MKKWIAGILAMLMLVSFAACGKTQTNETTAPTEPPVPRGNRVGELCYSFQVEIANENGPTGEKIDPTATGKITVINFWGTWCNPCVSELPHFDQIGKDYDVKVFAIHSVEGKKDMPKFIQEKYTETSLIFAYDEEVEGSHSGEYYDLLGGQGYYPYTLVLDSEGVIVHTQDGMMSYEELAKVIESAQ